VFLVISVRCRNTSILDLAKSSNVTSIKSKRGHLSIARSASLGNVNQRVGSSSVERVGPLTVVALAIRMLDHSLKDVAGVDLVRPNAGDLSTVRTGHDASKLT
jgi:hypothetical protein